MTPMWMNILAGQMVDVRFTHMAKEIKLMVVLPIFAGWTYNGIRGQRLQRLHRLLPVLSMAGIMYLTAVTTAVGRQHLLLIGWTLFTAAIIHNTAGYLLGYWADRLFGLDKASCRTIAIEVGLQNGGMACGLAGRRVGLAAAIIASKLLAVTRLST